MKVLISNKQYKKGICLILFLGVFICIWQLGSTGLVDETPPLFAAASRAMSETGNWLTPRVNGLNRFDKPPLIYWLMGIFYLIPAEEIWDPLGTWSARLPSAISTVLMMIFLGDTFMKFPIKNDPSPRRTAVVASLVFALSPLVVIWSRIAVSDSLLCATLGISLILHWRTYIKPVNKNWWLGWLILGLSVLTKGPVALVLTAMTLLIFGLVQRDYLTLSKRIKPIKGFFISIAVSLPWYIAELIVEGKPFWDSFFGYHNFQRFTSVVNNHYQPFWFFIIILFIASLPFTPFLIVSLRDFFYSFFVFNSSHIKSSKYSLLNFAGSWLLSVFLLFSFAATKLPSYWLPAVPAASIMIVLSSNNPDKEKKYHWISYLFISALMIIFAVIISNTGLWISSINDPEMPFLAREIMNSKLYIRAAIYTFILAFISLYFVFSDNARNILFLQIPLIFLQAFVMLPLWKLADNLRHKPVREVSKQLLMVQNQNEPIAMVGITKPSLHFYTKQLVTYESHDEIGLVNLSNRVRLEEREKWKKKTSLQLRQSDTLLLVIDKETSSYPYWKSISKKDLGTFGVYKIWRLELKNLEKKAILLRSNGFEPNWDKIKKERY